MEPKEIYRCEERVLLRQMVGEIGITHVQCWTLALSGRKQARKKRS